MRIILDHLHHLVELEKNQPTGKETHAIPNKSTASSVPGRTVKSGVPDNLTGGSEVLAKTSVKMKSRRSEKEDVAVCTVKVHFLTNSNAKKSRM